MKLAVYCITKNEEKFVDKMFESAKQADYIVVCDTGSTDQTWTKLKAWQSKLGKKKVILQQILVTPWRFDVARNTSLSLVPADADWCLCIDLDEVLVGNWRDFFTKDMRLIDVNRLHYQYIWSWDDQGNPKTAYFGDKIHTRHGFRWQHPVHEVLKPYLIEEKHLWLEPEAFQIHHFPDSTKSRGQYLPLLELAKTEDDSCDRNAYYLGREYWYQSRFPEAIAELQRHLALPRAKWKAERAASMRYIARSYAMMGDNDNAEKYFWDAIREEGGIREPVLDAAMHYYHKKDWPMVYVLARKAIDIPKLNNVYITEIEYYGSMAYDLLSVSAWNLGLKPQALEYINKALEFDPGNQRFLANKKFYEDEGV